MRWTEITIEAGPAAVDAVGQVLLRAGCQGFAVRDAETPPHVVGYLPADDRIEGRLDLISQGLEALAALSIEGAGAGMTLRPVEEADWANAWKAYYKPMRVGRHLIVTPPWEHPALGPQDVPVVIDPGMAFGTGSHPTTQLCLAALEDHLRPGMTVADVGTGSGILAIAAAKMGAAHVTATDIDSLAVKIAGDNARANGVTVETGEAFPATRYGLVVANILADVIIGLAEPFARIVSPGGVFITSGIIDTRESDVRFALEGVGFAPLETRRDGDWVALIFRRATV